VRERPVPPGARCPGRGIAPALERLILECLDKVPERRPSGAAALAGRLAGLAALLGRGRQRPAAATSAADTADLAASGIARAVAHAPAAETVDLAPVPRTRDAAASGAIGPASRADLRAGSRWRRRAALVGLAGAALGVAVALGVLEGPDRGSSQVASEAGLNRPGDSPATAVAATAPAGAGSDLAPRPLPDSRPARGLAVDAAPDSRPTGGLAVGAAPGPDSTGRPGRASGPPPASDPHPPGAGAASESAAAGARPAGGRTANQLRAERHVRAAEAARRSGNLLRQLAEADQARRLDPHSRRAAQLMGEALVKSGDRANGCPLLRRSPRLFRQAGCAD
jgi:hypothetical protein